MMFLSSFPPSSFSSSLPRAVSPPRPSSTRSHALCAPLLLFFFLLSLHPPATTAAPFGDDSEWPRDDYAAQFEAEPTTGGPSPRPSDPASLALSRSGAAARVETTTDRQIRPETITAQPTVPSPQIVSILQPTIPLPTVLATVLPIDPSSSTPEPTSSLELQNSRMTEIVANLTKKIKTQTTGSDVSITFTPDELKKLQEIIGATVLKGDAEMTRRQLMIPNGPLKKPDVYSVDDNKEKIRENPEKHEEFIDAVPISTPPPLETTSTVVTTTAIIEETTVLPTDLVPDDLEPDNGEDSVFDSIDSEDVQKTDITVVIDQIQPILPAVCKLNTEDRLISVIWMFLQSWIREWNYDEEQSTVLVLTTFGLLLDTEHSPIATDEPGFMEDIKAAIQCLFRDCRLAMPNKKIPERQVSMPSSPKKFRKRETVEYHSDLFECRCPSGYVFI